MNGSTILLAMPVFFLVYQAVGLYFESEEKRSWVGHDPTKEASSQAVLREFSNLSNKLGFNKVILQNKKIGERFDLLLLRSGYPFGWKSYDFLFFKEIVAVVFVFILWQAGTDQTMMYVMGAMVGFWIPDFYLQRKGEARKAEIQKKLPGFIDLITLTLEGGLDLLAAIDRILEKMRTNSLKEELALLLQENRLGTPRKEAFEHLAYRVNLPDLQSLTSIIIQSEELGTSLAGVLRNFAEDMRSRRILRAEEAAGKAPVKLLFPMAVFFFPIIFIIIFGPLALNFMSSYK